ncbi:uncharacterized protein LOC119273049 [Triticum dicoccoides]|uniref:uncharacterized protein LOC119273049 n=1 Tax=Triticum dicoccoides TaxID=85692 RepID=UPI00188E80E2|nr:uncharacterized protein LOC119273049 [Triticum dicoccoides]
MAASPLLLLLLVSLVSTAAATSNTSESWERKRSEEETRQIFREWKAMHGTTNSSLDEEEQRAYTMFKHRLGLIDRQWHDQGYSVFSWERGRSEEETRKIFAEWKARKPVTTYSSIAHEEHRYTIFKEDLRKIDQHNAGYAIGVHNNNRCLNQFSHLTQEEFEAVCCGFWPEEPSEAKLQRIGEIQELLRNVVPSVYRGTGLANAVGETNFAGLPKGQAKELAAQIASGVQAVQLSRRVLEKDQVEFHEMRSGATSEPE